MFEQIKAYANLILAAGLLAALGYSHYYAYSHGKAAGKAVVQAKFDSYKANINDQVQKAKDEAAIEKQRQENKYEQAQAAYSDVSRNLDVALKRLRDLKTVPGNPSVPVAGSGSGTMPSKTEDTPRADQAVITGTGIESTAFYSAAMSDTLQCRELIRFVTKD